MSSKWGALTRWRVLVNFFLGIFSGLPLMIATGSTLQAWMTDEKVDLKVIGLFALVGLPYTFKFAWAPIMDRYVPPILGRRRGWMLITQILLGAGLCAFAFVSPAHSPWTVAAIAFVCAFFSASQDIVIDAYRREVLTEEELGLGSSLHVNGYRVGMLLSGALALILADHIPWHQVYILMGASYLVAAAITFFAPDPLDQVKPPGTLMEAVVQPLVEYFRRRGALEVLVFILLYKVGDAMAGQMYTPFYLSLGFSKTEIGTIAKTFGMGATFLGLFVGGVLMLKLGIRHSLWVFGILQAISTALFAVLAQVGKSTPMLMSVIAFENLTAGMGTAAFVAFMASLTNKRFTATQYALLSSLMGVPRVILASPTGVMAQSMGYFSFFIFCALIAIPGLLLLLRAHKWQEPEAISVTAKKEVEAADPQVATGVQQR